VDWEVREIEVTEEKEKQEVRVGSTSLNRIGVAVGPNLGAGTETA
jgi:hypothetical protein